MSALYPFRTSFYREMGFALAGALHRYRFNPASLPIYPGWDHVERASEEGRDVAQEIYARVAERANGLLERSPRMWTFLDLAGAYLYLYRCIRGVPRGYVVVRGRGGPPEASRLRVLEMVAETREAYLGLLGWLSVQRDQWGTVVYDSVPGEDFYERLDHPRTEKSGSPRGLWFHSSSILRGPMFRVLDMQGLFALGADSGRVHTPSPLALADGTLQIRDPDIPENQGSWKDGERVSTTVDQTAGPVTAVGDVVKELFRGALPGQPLPPAGWEPNLGLTEVRLLDEF
jgi:hypothetical protein